MVMESVLERIKSIRKQKGYSHEYLAQELDISQVAYSKLEKNETKLTVERLFKLAEILETPIADLLDIKANNIYHQNNSDQAIGHQEVQNLYQENKDKTDKIIELYEARLQDKDRLIAQLSNKIKF
ncbi:hypothetical protein GCM10022258_26290 [Aquimarina gracilis]